MQSKFQFHLAESDEPPQTGGDFARLLLTHSLRITRHYDHWKDIFPLVYGGTVEELAAKRDGLDREFFPCY